MLLFYSDDYAQAKHEFDTTRKSQWIARSLRTSPISNVQLATPAAVTDAELRIIHNSAYIAAVKTGKPRYLAESQGFVWDENLYKAVCASTGGVIFATLTALRQRVSGSLSSGLHHARKKRGKGNCTFNGLALAAYIAKQQGVKSILILDTDAHCGGGTHSLVYSIPGVRHIDIATSAYDFYIPRSGNVLRIVFRASSYLTVLAKLLTHLENANARFDLCIYNAGMDVYEGCSDGGLSGVSFDILREREKMVFSWCRHHSIPIVFVIAGGYVSPSCDKQTLIDLHSLTIEEAVRYEYSRTGY